MRKHDFKLAEKFYRLMYLIRRVEEEIVRIYPSDKIKSPVHLSIGQEAVSVGVCEALRPKDVVFGTYRSHAMYLAKGGDLKKMIAELYGKSTGCGGGKGGSMHLIDCKKGIMGTSAIVGTTIPIAVGYAYGLKYQHSDSIVVSFFGDGAVDEGVFHESMNFAALKKLPILFVCENNYYAIHSHHLSRHSGDIYRWAQSYRMPAKRIENGDIFRIYEATKAYTERLGEGKGPAFLECFTCRWKEHVGPCDDFHLGYRSEKEVFYWKQRDQLKKIKQYLDSHTIRIIEHDVEQEIKESFDFAEQSSFSKPDVLYEELFKK